jgi:hypothetical protein
MAFTIDQQRIADFVDTEVSPLQALWARVNAQAAELDPEAAAYDDAIRKHNPRHQNGFIALSTKAIWLISLKQPAKGIRAGRICSCPPLLAAQCIVGGTHRLAAADEVRSWEEEQDRRKAEIKAQEEIKHPPPPAPVFHLHPTADGGLGLMAQSSLPVVIREAATAGALGKSHGGAKSSQSAD